MAGATFANLFLALVGFEVEVVVPTFRQFVEVGRRHVLAVQLVGTSDEVVFDGWWTCLRL